MSNMKCCEPSSSTTSESTIDNGLGTADPNTVSTESKLNMEINDSESTIDNGLETVDPNTVSTESELNMEIDDSDVNVSTAVTTLRHSLKFHDYSRFHKQPLVYTNSTKHEPLAHVSTNNITRKPLRLVTNSIIRKTSSNGKSKKLVPLTVRKCNGVKPSTSKECEISGAVAPEQEDGPNNVPTSPTSVLVIDKNNRLSLNKIKLSDDGNKTDALKSKSDAAKTKPKVHKTYIVKSKADAIKLNIQLAKINAGKTNPEVHRTYIVKSKADAVRLNRQLHKTDAGKTSSEIHKTYVMKSKANTVKLSAQKHKTVAGNTYPKVRKTYVLNSVADTVKLNAQLRKTDAGNTYPEVHKTYIGKSNPDDVLLNTEQHKGNEAKIKPKVLTAYYDVKSKAYALSTNMHTTDTVQMNTEVHRTEVVNTEQFKSYYANLNYEAHETDVDMLNHKAETSSRINDHDMKSTADKKQMTKDELNVQQELLDLKTQLFKCEKKLKRQAVQLKAAKKLMTNTTFLKTIEKLPPSAKIMTLMQFRESGKKTNARRFTEEEKKLSLSIRSRSVKAYKIMRKMFIMPSPRTLSNLYNNAAKPAENKNDALAQLRSKAAKMKTINRLCVLLFDEKALDQILTYKQRKDTQSPDEETRMKFAQVFMVRGILKNYSHPVTCTFLSTATWSGDLAEQIKTVIAELQETGFIVLATVCRQADNHREAIDILTSEAKGLCMINGIQHNDNSFFVNDREIITLYDPPHLLKAIRNSFLTKHLIFESEGRTKIAQWQHVEMLLNENPGYNGISLVPKLTKAHVNPTTKIAKTKVKFASQVFSQTVAKYMGFLAVEGKLPQECAHTAEVLLFFDQLFDSVNGCYVDRLKHQNPLLRPVKPSSRHHKIWSECKIALKNMRFSDEQYAIYDLPTIEGWIWTLEGLEKLVRMLQNQYNVTSVWMRNLNQEPLETFFEAK